MARALMLGALALSSACFHATPYSAASSQQKWRAMRGNTPTSGVRSPTDGTVLDADETIELALANNPQVAVLAAQADVAAAQVGAAKQIDNPQLRFTGFNIDDVIDRQGSMNIGLRVPIPRPGTVRAEVAGAKQIAAGQDALTEEAERLLRAQVYKLFARLAMLNKDIEQTAKATALRAERREQISARAAMSAATQLDVAMADVLHAESKQDDAEARDELAAVEAELRRIVGTDREVSFAVDESQLKVVDADLDRDALTERAMEKRPSLRTAHANVQAARAETYIARSESYPWFSWAQVQYRVERDARPSA
ncbi:MAG TPA: TolC family protein, partial [Nannocystaceae bacterium]|nr:TolC family protein [Nannocystaceae bacterium]